MSRRARVVATLGGGAAPVVVDGQAHATIASGVLWVKAIMI